MIPRAIRAALTCVAVAATMLVILTLARPAHAAAAPFCDDRGATALAAPPALEAPDEAIGRARVTGCDHRFDADVLMSSLGPSHGKTAAATGDPGPAALTAAVVPAPIESVTLRADEPAGRPCIGARGRVERPPRV